MCFFEGLGVTISSILSRKYMIFFILREKKDYLYAKEWFLFFKPHTFLSFKVLSMSFEMVPDFFGNHFSFI